MQHCARQLQLTSCDSSVCLSTPLFGQLSPGDHHHELGFWLGARDSFALYAHAPQPRPQGHRTGKDRGSAQRYR